MNKANLIETFNQLCSVFIDCDIAFILILPDRINNCFDNNYNRHTNNNIKNHITEEKDKAQNKYK